MRKILSYLVLLMLFATNSHAAVTLTQSMFNQTDCAYNLNTNVGGNQPVFGDNSVIPEHYADLSNYDILIVTMNSSITTPGSGNCRLFFNVEWTNQAANQKNQTEVSYNSNTQCYRIDGNKMIIDLNAVKNLTNKDHVYLHTIKNVWSQNPGDVTAINVKSLELDNRITVSNPYRYDLLRVEGNNSYSLANQQPNVTTTWNEIHDASGNNPVNNWTFRFDLNAGGNTNLQSILGYPSYDGSNSTQLTQLSTAFNNLFTVTSSNPNVLKIENVSFGATRSGDGRIKMNINGIKFGGNCGTTTISLAYKGDLTYAPFTYDVTLTVTGIDRKLVWIIQGNRLGQTGGGKITGTYWARKNISELYNSTQAIKYTDQVRPTTPIQECANTYYPYSGAKLNQETFAGLSSDLYFTAIAVDMDQYYQDLVDAYNANPTEENYYNVISVRKIKSKTSSQGTDQGGDIWWLNNERYINGVENVGGKLRFNQNANNINNKYLYQYDQEDGLSNEVVGGNNFTEGNKTIWVDRAQVKVQYSINDIDILDAFQANAQERTNNTSDKVWSYHLWPEQDVSPDVSPDDSLTVYAELPGYKQYSAVKIWTKVKLQKNNIALGFQPKEGTVTEGEFVIPYVNIPDIKLKAFEKILVWIEDETVASVDVSNPNNYEMITVDGVQRKAYILYKDGDTDTQYLRTRYDDNKGTMVDAIYPKITGLSSNKQTKVHLILQTYTFNDCESTYTINVVHDNANNGPAFHWYVNDDGEQDFSQHIGRSKATYELDKVDDNGNIIEEYNTIKYGDDDGEIKEITMIEGDYIYMPGIVGSANGNMEYSNSSENGNRYYMYGINNGNVIMNYDRYYYGEGVPNYFLCNQTPQVDGTWTSVADDYFTFKKYRTPDASSRKIPTNGTSKSTLDNNDFIAYIFKSYITGKDKRGDTLMIYGAKQGVTYLYAEDPQTHKVCTPIKINVLSRQQYNTQQKQVRLSNMSFPYTWDFQHMDMREIQNDVNNNCASYWEVHRESPDKYYQANGFFNADWEDKNNSGDLRQRWFKDLTANGKYMPQFDGIMLNIAGMDWWDQKYNRFNIAKDGSNIYFQGGPHFISLPGFGIFNADETNASYNSTHNYPSNTPIVFHGSATRTGQITDNDELISVEGTIDGTRNHDNVVGSLHNQMNIIHDGFLGPNDFGWNLLPNKNSEANLMNTKVKLVINAYHTAGALPDLANKELPHFSIGGKSMMPNGLSVNAINEAGAKVVLYNVVGDCSSSSDVRPEVGHTYVFDINPYDPEFQDHIYIEFDHNVHVNWIAISTEPRELRSDYEVFTYSYPKDIDMDKTNQVMGMVTAKELGQSVQFTTMYAKEYNRTKSELTVDRVDPVLYADLDKFAANEGVLIYPTPTIQSIIDAGTTSDLTDYRLGTGLVKQQQENKDVVRIKKVDEDGNYVYETARYTHTYYYLPTYFIANAENVENYNDHHWQYEYTVASEQGGTKTEEKLERVNRGKVPLINGNITETSRIIGDGTIPINNKVNKLSGSPYKTWIDLDYYTDETGHDYSTTASETRNVRWIPLGLCNEYIARKLENDDQAGYENDYKKLADYLRGEDGQEYNGYTFDYSGRQVHDAGYYYYDLIGPKIVRFYRANNAEHMKSRRSYLTLTWKEYYVNTNGKDGVNNPDGSDPTSSPGSEGPDANPFDSNTIPFTVAPVRIVFATANGDEILVSDDAGIPDGIEEVKEQTDGNNVFYNLNGVRVNTPQKGIYILNGRKIIVK